ncbi:sorting nexin-25 isoform X2 [Venturia canescens]|uniref:sorting nexin-25 isoform X2 n=1 Tax=Venturia canescens TaxID=32260 RepID=UPI001C9C0AA2|nr:sorting nexin-25 isoform X2 [Venturia canescens]
MIFEDQVEKMFNDIIRLMKKGRQKILLVVLLITFGIYLILKSDTLVWFYFFGLLTVSCCFLGPLVIILIHVALSPNHQTGAGTTKTVIEMDAFRTMLMKGYEPKSSSNKRQIRYPVVFTRLVDGALQNLLDLAFRDFVGCWLNELAFCSDHIITNMKQDVWGAIQSLHERLSRVDHTKLVACSIVNRVTFHFEKIRIAQAAASEGEDPVFVLSPHLMSRTDELEYLRRVSEICIMFFLPRSYSISPAKFLLREVITCKILKPAIDLITDPDYINQKILLYIEQQQLAEAMHRKTYEYAESFEDFIRMIKSSKDIEVLKHIRYNIVTEIMQATTVQNVKRAQGLDPENNSFGKSDTVQAKKLKRYISQLTYAKNTCECHMQTLGWDGYPIQECEIADAAITSEGRVLPLQTVLDNITGRRYLTQFLEQVASQGLIGYWAAVQELRAADRSHWHQLGAEIFYTYIRSSTAEIKVDKNVRKRMESFLLGDKGPDVFYEVQEDVVKVLEDKYYPSFLVSEQYRKMQEALLSERADGLAEDRQLVEGSLSEHSSLLVGDHSNYARSKLDQLEEKLNNKMQALQALRTSLKPESRVLSILAKEVEWLQGEKRQLEAHLTHTEMWAEHLGRWRADVQSAETPDNGDPPQFILVVHMAEDEGNAESISTGWVVFRKLPEFQELHRKLRQLCSNVKTLELPSQPLKFFGKTDKNSLDKAKMQIQKYLNFVLEDDRLNQSEALYAFLSPSSEHLKHTTPSPKKSRFSLSTLFKSGSGGSGDSRDKDEDEDYSLLLDDNEAGRAGTDAYMGPGKDAIAEPLYGLLGEVFDLRGVFRWLRRSLITFVQITYGRTINRQVRDTVAWVFSEPMLHYYIQLFTKSWWPNGQIVSSTVSRTDEEKLKTRGEARRQFLNNLPEVLANLVGAQSSQRGATKVFDTLQNVNLNKQLFYDIFEVLMYEIFPELQHK